MPCVNLANIRQYRAMLKAERAAFEALREKLPSGTISSCGIKAPTTPLHLRIKRNVEIAKVKSNTVQTKPVRNLATDTNSRAKANLAKPVAARQLRRHPSRADLINAESRIGSTIFGPIPEGHRREFFHDKNNVWIWHEDWLDHEDNLRQMTVRYEVRPSGIYKKISAGNYVQLAGAELENFCQATHVYLYAIKQKLYAYARAN